MKEGAGFWMIATIVAVCVERKETDEGEKERGAFYTTRPIAPEDADAIDKMGT